MNTITLSRADAETVVMCLHHLMRVDGWALGPLYSDITEQLDEQES